MTKNELYEVVRDAEVEAFDAWQKQEASSKHVNNYHTAFLVLRFLSNALHKAIKR